MAQAIDCLLLSTEHRQAMFEHARACLPEEACGLLGGQWTEAVCGRAAHCRAVLTVTNALHSASRFRMDPQAQWEALAWIEAQGMELVAIFHSHPAGPNHPSATDLAEFAYPGVPYLILSPNDLGQGWHLNAYWLHNGDYTMLQTELFSSNGLVKQGL